MTLHQLEYIVALDKHRHFGKAATECNITQSTLSTMVKKLEEELDTTIFDRDSHPLRPTMAGERIIKQAHVVLYNANQLQELSLDERQRTTGNILLGVTPTIAPYIIPKLFRYIATIDGVTMRASELHRIDIIKRLKNAELDMAIMSLTQKVDGLLAIPLYHERFYAYVSPADPLWQQESICSMTMPRTRLWALKNQISFQVQIAEFAEHESERSSMYESGNIATLLRIVNENEGFTVIPELHIPQLRKEDQGNLRPLVDPILTREVSLYIREDYVREGLLNIIAEGVKQIIPASMLDSHIAKYPIRL